MRDKDVHRYETQVNSDKVMIDTTAPKDIIAQPKWDSF